MIASALLKLIPKGVFRQLAMETRVDHQVKKLSGELIFKLVLFSMLNSDKLSLRVMEGFLDSAAFQSFAQEQPPIHSKYNSIRDRICTLNAAYFEKLFEQIFAIYSQHLGEASALCKADSTCVSLAAKLFAQGMQSGKDSRRQVKYSVVMKGSLPASFKIFTEQSYVAEDKALGQLIEEAACLRGGVVVIDRGLKSRERFEKISRQGKAFICRVKTNSRMEIVSSQTPAAKPKEATLTVHSDESGYLFHSNASKTEGLYRLIKATLDKSGEEMWLVSNIMEEDAYTLAQWYKQRWEIEVFFKFLKQHLNFKHLVSRTENGMKVMLYLTMILAILLLAYKKINKIKSYKIAKLRFEIQLENDMIKNIVLLCGGNPDKAAYFWNTS